MKEQILLYGVSGGISFIAVFITSIIKIIVTKIAKKCGRELSGGFKEYIFTPLSICIAAVGLYFWLNKFIGMPINQEFIFIVACFSLGTMILYLLIFQPTRKLALKIIRTLINQIKISEVPEIITSALSEAGNLFEPPKQADEVLQTSEKIPDECMSRAEKPADCAENCESVRVNNSTDDAAAEKLRIMVENIKNK